MNRKNKTISAGAVIVAGGSGKRFGSDTPKQFLPFNGKPLFLWSVQAFLKARSFRQVVVVVPQDWVKRLAPAGRRHGFEVVAGGRERFDSVQAGIARLAPGIDYIAIHDGARPLISVKTIDATLDAAVKTGAALAAVPARDTIKISSADCAVKSTVPRDTVWFAQTPQIFKRSVITTAYRKLTGHVTDDAQAVERAGHKVRLVMGEYRNIKVTDKNDLALAKTLAKRR